MNYLIIEDEPIAAERLEEKIQALRPHWKCLQVLATGTEILEKFSTAGADLAFVDIHLGDGSSFHALDKVQSETPLIFTTAYDQYAIRAFKHNSIDYLLKPIHNDDLKRALEKFEKSGRNRVADAINWSEVLQDLKPQFKERFLVSSGERLRTVKSEDCAFFHASGKHCFLMDFEGGEHLIDYNLKELSEVLDPKRFFQINRQYIINMEAIQELQTHSKSRLMVVSKPSLGPEGIVSAERSTTFKRWLQGEL